MRVFGILFVILGVILLIYGGFTLLIPRDTQDIGPFTITIREDLVIPLPPILGVALLLVGIVMILSAPRVVVPPGPY